MIKQTIARSMFKLLLTKLLLIKLPLVLLAALTLWTNAQAQEATEQEQAQAAVQELIRKVTAAYGGEALTTLSSYQVRERYLSIAEGQNHHPSLKAINRSSQILSRDIRNNKTAFGGWAKSRDGGFQSAVVSDGEKAFAINYQNKTFGEANSADFKVFAGGTMRTSDAILVYELNKVVDQAKLQDDARFNNRLHHVISMPFPSSPDLVIYVDAETFLISKMVRVNPQLGNLDYVFSDYKTHNGIRYASSTNFFIAGSPNLISLQRELLFNVDFVNETFAVPDGFKEQPDRLDDSELVVNKISDRVYHLGQQGGYSLFVDTSVGVVAAGGYPGLDDRLQQFQTLSKRFTPLNYQVVTHHHSDHIGGLPEAVALGARLVTVADNVQTIKDIPNAELTDRDFQVVGSRATFGEGPTRVEIYEVSTSHAASFLLTYVPSEKLVFIADHMGSPFANATPVATLSTVGMLQAIEALDIDVRKIATAHNARIFSIKDMRASVAAYQPGECLGNHPVCKFAAD